MGIVSASHTYHKGKYSFTVSDKTFNQIEKAKENGGKIKPFTKKTGKYKTYKVPKYKNKKVTKYKWKYKKVKVWKYDNVWGDYKSYKLPSKYRSWKYVGDDTKTSSNGQYSYGYHIFKKKVKYTVTKKVKTGTKKLKLPVKACVGWYKEDGQTTVYVEYIVESKGMVYYGDGWESVLSKKLGYYEL